MARNPHPQPTQAAGHRGTATYLRAGFGVARAAGQASPVLPPGYQAAARYAMTQVRQGYGATGASLRAGHTPPPAVRLASTRPRPAPPVEARPSAAAVPAAPAAKSAPGPAELAAAHPQLALAFAVAAAAQPVRAAGDQRPSHQVTQPTAPTAIVAVTPEPEPAPAAVIAPAAVAPARPSAADADRVLAPAESAPASGLVPVRPAPADADPFPPSSPTATPSAPQALGHGSLENVAGRHASRSPDSRPQVRPGLFGRSRSRAVGPATRWSGLFERSAIRHSRSGAGRRVYRPVSAAASAALVSLVTMAVVNSGGTLALWNDTADAAGGVILSGDLNIERCSDKPGLRWMETSADVAPAGFTPRSSAAGDSLADFKAMPGDSILISQCVEVTLKGDNLASAVEVTAWASAPALGLVSSPGPGLVADNTRIKGTYAIKDLAAATTPPPYATYPYPDLYYTFPVAPGDTDVRPQAGSPPVVGESVYVLIPALPRSDPDWGNPRAVKWEIEVTVEFTAKYSGDPTDHVLAFDPDNFGYDGAYRNLKTPGTAPADIGLVEFGVIANQVRFGDGWTTS